MKARESLTKKRCVHCGEQTVFVRTLTGPRGGRYTEDCCVYCGESESRRKFYADKKAAA